MSLYKIKVRADSKDEAIKLLLEDSDRWMEEVKEPVIWKDEADYLASDIVEGHEQGIDEMAMNLYETHKDKAFEPDWKQVVLDSFDFYGETPESKFIYTDNESMLEALNCIDELREWADDSDYFRDLGDIEMAINAIATHTLFRAVEYMAREKAASLLEARYFEIKESEEMEK